jgi:hypothetical protein
LQILHRLAVENARDSADSQRDKRNKDTVLPTFKTGDKVLLFDPTTKSESPKLKVGLLDLS